MRNTRLSNADAALLSQHCSDIGAIFDQYIPRDRPVALLQYPLDCNVGNHMMWLSITDYLRQRGVGIAYAAHQYNFRMKDMVRAVGDGPILFLGGVTVSRLWPTHAEIKRVVATACPGNRLISLPSTILFLDDDDRREAGSMFGDHQDVIMMARDPASARFACEVFPDSVTVVPVHDSAFRLPPQPRTGKAAHDVIWLARDDHERTGAMAPGDVHVFDWSDYVRLGRGQLVLDRVFSRLRREAPVLDPIINPPMGAGYDWISRWVLARGNSALDDGKVLVTDRLHPHVLAALRSQPTVLLPDRFGKNRAVYDYSSSKHSTVHWADTPQRALELARDLAAHC